MRTSRPPTMVVAQLHHSGRKPNYNPLKMYSVPMHWNKIKLVTRLHHSEEEKTNCNTLKKPNCNTLKNTKPMRKNCNSKILYWIMMDDAISCELLRGVKVDHVIHYKLDMWNDIKQKRKAENIPTEGKHKAKGKNRVKKLRNGKWLQLHFSFWLRCRLLNVELTKDQKSLKPEENRSFRAFTKILTMWKLSNCHLIPATN